MEKAPQGKTIKNVIRIGVTGHRVLPHYGRAALSVKKVIDRIARGGGSASNLVVLSPIAEGADRLVAAEMMDRSGGVLEAVLPMEPPDYMEDFHSEKSKAEFKRLLSLAIKVHVMPPEESRSEAYLAAGQFVVDNSDIMVALWDGKKGRGRSGTAGIVAYAREKRKPLYWINSEEPEKITEEKVHER